jgi:DNA-binding NtrC family response regulator
MTTRPQSDPDVWIRAETPARQAPVPHDVTFIEKPFTRDSLLMAIRRILDSEEENNELGRAE